MNYLLMMTKTESERWDKLRSAGRLHYVFRQTIAYGVLPAVILSVFAIWTSQVIKIDASFTKFVVILTLLFIPLNFLFYLAFWHFEEYRYKQRSREIEAPSLFKD